MFPVLGTSSWQCSNERCERANPPELAGAKAPATDVEPRRIITPSEARRQGKGGIIIPER